MTNVYVCVVDCERYDLPDTLVDMRYWIEMQWDSIPAEYRDEAIFDIDSTGRIEVGYWRPETEEERARRANLRQREAAWGEARERAMLAWLKDKYEGKS